MENDKEMNNNIETNEGVAENTAKQPERRTKRILIIRRPKKMEIKSGYVLRKVGQAYMVVPTGPRMKEYEGMITLNETGAFLFKEIQKPDQTAESLRQACMDEYGATEQEAYDAVESFMYQCCECGLIEYEDIFNDEDGNRMTREEFDAMREREMAEAMARMEEAKKGEGNASGKDE